MTKNGNKVFSSLAAFLIAISMLSNCTSSARGRYFGKTVPPADDVLHYVTGSEPETLDPHISTGQPEARIYMAIYDGLVEYGPKDQQPIPAVAKSWEISPNVDEFIFHLRDNARWSDGKAITSHDFVYSFRRAFRPDVISSIAELGFFIQYAEAAKTGQVFVKKNGEFLLAKDFGDEAPKPAPPFGPETAFHHQIHLPPRLLLDGDDKLRAKQLEADPKLKTAAEGAEFVPVTPDDIGIEAVDDLTLRITLKQPAPFFVGLLAHQLFRLVPEQSVEKWGKDWTKKEHIVTCGAFKVKDYRPYDALVLEKDPFYWDAANVHLNGLEFFPLEENATILNLYKGGTIEAFLNHSVISSWVDDIRQYKDEYMNFPENATAYYSMNVTKAPFNDPKVRRAFFLATDVDALSEFRKVTKPLYRIVPTGIYPDYDKAMEKVGDGARKERGISLEEWEKSRRFNPEQARKMLTDAGFPVQKNGNSYSCPTFPTDIVAISFNTNENNRSIAEFVQAQWKQNLGVTVPLQSQEFKTFLKDRHDVQYGGFSQSLWSGDYMDPYTFLGLHYGYPNNGDTGFKDPKYDKMLDDANAELDPQKRYEMLARAELYLLDQLPSIPLTINATNWMKKPYVKGMYPNPGTLLPWKFVYIEHDPAKWDRDVDNIMTESDPQVEKQLAEITATQKSQ